MGKKIDLTGRRFGKLLVLEKTDERRSKAVVYKCLCECGKTIKRGLTNIMRISYAKEFFK